MIRFLIPVLVLASSAIVTADIQAPPGSVHTPVRKLSRGLANIIYGAYELPATFERVLREEGGQAAFSYGLIEGVNRSGKRIGFGLFEVANFPAKTYKKSYRAPYKSLRYDPVNGFTEFPPHVGFGQTNHIKVNPN